MTSTLCRVPTPWTRSTTSSGPASSATSPAAPSCRAEVASLRGRRPAGRRRRPAPPPALRDAVLRGITRVRPLPPAALHGAAVRSTAGSGFPRWWLRSSSPWSASEALSGSRGATTRRHRERRRPGAARTPPPSASPDARHGGVTATVVRSAKLNRAVIVTENMPAPPDGKVYQLWLQTDRHMVSAGLMPAGPTPCCSRATPTTPSAPASRSSRPAGPSSRPRSSPCSTSRQAHDRPRHGGSPWSAPASPG